MYVEFEEGRIVTGISEVDVFAGIYLMEDLHQMYQNACICAHYCCVLLCTGIAYLFRKYEQQAKGDKKPTASQDKPS